MQWSKGNRNRKFFAPIRGGDETDVERQRRCMPAATAVEDGIISKRAEAGEEPGNFSFVLLERVE